MIVMVKIEITGSEKKMASFDILIREVRAGVNSAEEEMQKQQ